MAIVTGDSYLDLLARFVEENIAQLLDGGRVLKLNPVGLHYVQTRLEALHELERLRASAPVDYLRAYVSDLGDHRALELLRRVLSLLAAVKVISVLEPPARDPSPIDLSPFGQLRSLELRGCDLSTAAARGLLDLRVSLEKLICHNSTDALRHIFAERIVEIRDAPGWTRLTFVSCPCNGMLLMDESLQLLPVIEVLDLSRNCLSHVANLQKCIRLKFLDLSFNRLQNLLALNQASVTITTLLLRNNALCSTNGIERLYLLEALDLSCNVIFDFHELEKLASLPFLHLLLLHGNPISFSSNYRVRALSFFLDPNKLFLDGKQMTQREVWEVRKMSSEKHEKGSAYGLYALAKRNFDNSSQWPQMISSDTREISEEKAKRKNYRLAAIEEEGEITPLGVSDKANEMSISIHASSLPTHAFEQEMPIVRQSNFQDETSVEKLMDQIEVLKREASSSWLTDFNMFLDDNNGHSSDSFKSNNVKKGEQKSPQLHKQKEKVIRGEMSASNLDEGISFRENLKSLNVFEDLVDPKLSSSSATSPPRYNQSLLQRRQHLEELLQLQLGSGASSASSSDSETSSESSAALISDSSSSAADCAQDLGSSPVAVDQSDKTSPRELIHETNVSSNGDAGHCVNVVAVGSVASAQEEESHNMNAAETSGNRLNAEIASESCLAEVGEEVPPEALIQRHPKSSKRVPRVVVIEEAEAECALSEGDSSKEDGSQT